MEKEFRIGCSGYYYSLWKNKFYPENLPANEWLSYYSMLFNTVELNAPFYKVPKVYALKRYAEATSDDFVFSVKMNKFFTHNHRLNNCKNDILNFQNLLFEGLGEKMQCFLFQMPPSFHYNDEHLQRIIENVPHSKENVIEFRHESWWNETVQKELRKANITFCNVDFPGLKSHILSTTSFFYFRFHGNPRLFTSQYSIEELNNVYKNLPDSFSRAFIYFNNTNGEAGYTNAMQFSDLIIHA